MTHLENIPPSIVKAISEIKQTVNAVAKSNRNAHGGYNYASADDVYAALARKMGEVGLTLLTLEDHCEIKRYEAPQKDGTNKMVQWAHLIYQFVWATEDATWSHPKNVRSLYIQVTGPQTFQAAQSFAEKSYLRSTFKLPTGDMDLDSMPQADNEDDQIALNAPGRKRKSSAEGKRDGSVKVFNELRKAVSDSISTEMLSHVRTTYAEEWAIMPRAWAETLDEEYEVKMMELQSVSAAE